MPSFIVTHGSIKVGGKFVSEGGAVELSEADAETMKDCLERRTEVATKEPVKPTKGKP